MSDEILENQGAVKFFERFYNAPRLRWGIVEGTSKNCWHEEAILNDFVHLDGDSYWLWQFFLHASLASLASAASTAPNDAQMTEASSPDPAEQMTTKAAIAAIAA